MPEPDLLTIERGSVIAPAGCGKTQLIANGIARHKATKPILVLTHTNAGVAALRSRLNRAGVPTASYRLATIDAWAIRAIQRFPTRAGHDPAILDVARPDYPEIRQAAINLLRGRHIDDVVAASYGRLLVDEYQDCSIVQHSIVLEIARSLPTCVVGDPVQAIFGWAGPLVEWDNHVVPAFPAIGELNRPWRWINADALPLGEWLLDVRRKLLNREPIDLEGSPGAVRWVALQGNQQDRQRQLRACRTRGPEPTSNVLIIADSTSPPTQRRYASQTPGAIAVEAVDLRDLVQFAERFDLQDDNALQRLVTFAQSLMTGVGAADLIQRVETLQRGRARRDPSHVEALAVQFQIQPSYLAMSELLSALSYEGGNRVYRPAVLSACLRAAQKCVADPSLSFEEAAILEREQYRFVGRQVPKRAVGSTLLLKGLEADVVVIHDAHTLDARNLYVALTRGSKGVVICSRSRELNPDW